MSQKQLDQKESAGSKPDAQTASTDIISNVGDHVKRKVEHSPLPWELISNEKEGIVIYCPDKSHLKTSRLMGNYRGVVVCDFDNAVGSYLARPFAVSEANANADLIVTAVNSYEANQVKIEKLVRACRGLISIIGELDDGSKHYVGTIEFAQKVLTDTERK